MKALKELPCPLTNNFALPSDTSAQAASCRCKQRLTRRIRSFAEERSQLPASCLQTYDSWLHTAQPMFADESAEIEAAAACRASLSYSQLGRSSSCSRSRVCTRQLVAANCRQVCTAMTVCKLSLHSAASPRNLQSGPAALCTAAPAAASFLPRSTTATDSQRRAAPYKESAAALR